MGAYDCIEDFSAVVAVGVVGVALLDVNSDHVKADFIDEPTDWIPARAELESGIYHVEGEYHYDEVGIEGNPHYLTAAYENVVWTKVSSPSRDYLAGSEACRKGEPCPSDASDEFILGYSARKAATEAE